MNDSTWNKWLVFAGGVLWFVALLSGCGKNVPQTCTTSIEATESKTFGTLEEIKCGPGEVIVSIHPNFIAGGTIVSVDAVCGKVVQTCKEALTHIRAALHGEGK